MEGNGKGLWDVVSEYPFGSLVVSLSLIWSVERVMLAIIDATKDVPIVATRESEEPNKTSDVE